MNETTELFSYLSGSKISLRKRFKILNDNLFPLFENLMKNVLDIKNFPKSNLDIVIQNVIPATSSEHKEKLKHKEYYKYNVIAAKHVLKRLTSIIDQKKHPSNVFKSQYSAIVDDFVFSLIVLVADAQTNLEFPVIPNLISSVMIHRSQRMWNAAMIILYGPDFISGVIHPEIDMALGALRISVENRIRAGFGCYAIYNPNNNQEEPLKMSTIFTILNKHKKKVKLLVDFDNLERIYKFCNPYVHSGKHSYFWYPYLIQNYLAPLFIGGKINDETTSLNAGIQLSNSTLDSILNDLSMEINKNKKETSIDKKLISIDKKDIQAIII